MVNEGPLKICDTFLSKEARAVQEADGKKVLIERLSYAMSVFVNFCGYATELNKSIIEEKHIAFHNMVTTHLAELRSKVSQYLCAGHTLKSSFTKADLENKSWRNHKAPY